jgi:16S rRNA G1207 methylase RsmC
MNAIVQNKHIFKDKVVLDVGCGTAILSMYVIPNFLLSRLHPVVESFFAASRRNDQTNHTKNTMRKKKVFT